ncbi:MAG TPA: HAMP domain-containing protein [Firmicutes bacterium]|nr:HAMP domain-containing protein [Bacillota bacterium]
MGWLYNLKTQRKMLILNVLLALNLAWISGTALLRMGNIQQLVKQMYTEQLQAVSGLRELDSGLASLEASRQKAAMANDPAMRATHQEEFAKRANELRVVLGKVKSALAGTKDGSAFEKVASDIEGLIDQEQGLVEQLSAGDTLTQEVVESLNQRAEAVQTELDLLVQAKEKQAAESYRLSGETYRSTVVGQIAIILVGVVINVLMGIFIAGLITRPLNRIVQTVEAVAQGDLSRKAEVQSKDEIGLAAKALNRAIDNLRGLIQQVSRTAEQVATSSEELAASSSETGKTTSQVASTIEQLAKGTEEQATSAQLADETVGQMMNLLRGVTEKLQAMVGDSGKASQLAKEGRESVKKAIGQMTSISESVTSSAGVVQGLGERSREIGQIVDLITGIADQTNLLALNAAIEAARAGEQGRGFAVVAEEVRKLAEQSRQAAERISGLIREIQTETSKAVAAMEAGTKEVAAGTSVIDETGQAFREIAGAVETVVARIHEVSEAANQVTQGAEQVVKAVENIANITEESAASAEEVSAGAEEQTASVQEIAASAEALARMAQELQEEVAKFRL